MARSYVRSLAFRLVDFPFVVQFLWYCFFILLLVVVVVVVALGICFEMDYKGQDLAETVYQVIITIFGIAGFIWGYILGDLTRSFHVWCVGMVLAGLVCLPSWPCFNRNPVKWLDALPAVRPRRAEPKRTKVKKDKAKRR